MRMNMNMDMMIHLIFIGININDIKRIKKNVHVSRKERSWKDLANSDKYQCDCHKNDPPDNDCSINCWNRMLNRECVDGACDVEECKQS